MCVNYLDSFKSILSLCLREKDGHYTAQKGSEETSSDYEILCMTSYLEVSMKRYEYPHSKRLKEKLKIKSMAISCKGSWRFYKKKRVMNLHLNFRS